MRELIHLGIIPVQCLELPLHKHSSWEMVYYIEGTIPHLHIIATDGCFGKDGSFIAGVAPNASHLEPLFRLEVLKMLKHEGKITDAVIENLKV